MITLLLWKKAAVFETVSSSILNANDDAALIEKHAVYQSPHRIEELIAIFVHATQASTPVNARSSMILTTVCTDGDRLLGYGGCCVEVCEAELVAESARLGCRFLHFLKCKRLEGALFPVALLCNYR